MVAVFFEIRSFRGDGARVHVDRCDRAGQVLERSRDDFVRGDGCAVVGLGPAHGDLVAAVDLAERTGLGVAKGDRVGRVAAEDGVRRGRDLVGLGSGGDGEDRAFDAADQGRRRRCAASQPTATPSARRSRRTSSGSGARRGARLRNHPSCRSQSPCLLRRHRRASRAWPPSGPCFRAEPQEWAWLPRL